MYLSRKSQKLSDSVFTYLTKLQNEIVTKYDHPHFTKLKSDGVGTEGGTVPLLLEESWLLGDLKSAKCMSMHFSALCN